MPIRIGSERSKPAPVVVQCRVREPLGLDQRAGDEPVDREDDRPADPVAERGQRPDERQVLAPRLVRVERDAARLVREHRRQLGVDVVLERAEARSRSSTGRTPRSYRARRSSEPSAAIRKPGFARATTKPSHQVIALRSCRSSTTAVRHRPLLSRTGRSAGLGPIWYTPARRLVPRRAGRGQPARGDSRSDTWTRATRGRTRPGLGPSLYERSSNRGETMSEKEWGDEPYLGPRATTGIRTGS